MKWLCTLLLILLTTSAAADDTRRVYLENLNLSMIDQEWGEAHYRQSVSWKDLSINGTPFEHGVGTHARSEFSIDLGGECREFHARVGVDDGASDAASIEFRVLLDDREVFSSGVMKRGMEAREVVVPLAGAKRLTLLVDDGDDGIGNDHADWADAFITTSSASPAAIPPSHSFVRQMRRHSISGVIRLPGDQVASEDLKVWVNVWDDGKKSIARKPFLIRTGTGAVPFSLTFSRHAGWSRQVSVGYEGAKSFLPKAYLGGGGMVETHDEAAVLTLEDRQAPVVLTLVPGFVVQGRVRLPEGSTTEGEVKCAVVVADQKLKTVAKRPVLLSPGSTAAEFQLVVSPHSLPDAFLVYLETDSKDFHPRYFVGDGGTTSSQKGARSLSPNSGPLAADFPLVRQAAHDLPKPEQAVWLEELNLSFMTSGWRKPLAQRSVTNRTLTLKGQVYRHGIGTHAPSEMEIDLKGAARRFRAVAGLDDGAGGKGAVRFAAYGDGRLLFVSEVMRASSTPVQIDLDLSGVQRLRLVVEKGEKTTAGNHADWASAYIVFAAGAAPPEAYDPATPPQSVWLETLDLGSVRQGWGVPQRGCNVHQNPITLNGTVYRHGIGTHAVSKIAINLDRKALRFTALAGIDDGAKGGAARFVVYGDDQPLFDSGLLRPKEQPRLVDVDTSGIGTLILLVDDGGNGTSNDWACWADARLEMKPGAGAADLSTRQIPDRWRAEYFNNTELAGEPVFRSEEFGPLNLTWGRSSPAPAVRKDHFTARFTRTALFEQDGHYTIRVKADGGFRVYVDAVPVLDRWMDQKPVPHLFPIYFSQGKHTITVEYLEQTGKAQLAFAYQKAPETDQTSLSGSLHLPAGDRAGTDGAAFYLTAVDSESHTTYWGECRVAPGQTSCSYALPLPAVRRHYLISYQDRSNRYLGTGYYGGAETVWEKGRRKLVAISGSSVTGIDLTVARGVRVTGTVLLKEGDVAQRDERITIKSFTMDGTFRTATTVVLPRGARSVPYTLFVPRSRGKTSHYLVYTCDIPGYTREIKEDLNRWGKMTVTTVITPETEEKAADVRLYKKAVISGTVSLPPGHFAPADGMRVEVKALQKEHDEVLATTVTIPEGQSAAPYSIEVPAHDKDHEKYVVRYVHWGAGFVRAAYWSSTGMIPFGSFPLTWHLDVSQGDRSGIDLTLIPDQTVLSREEEEEHAMEVAKEFVRTSITPDLTEFEKLLVIFDYMTSTNVYYSDKAAQERGLKVMENVWSYNAVFVNHVTVCGGYAKGLNYLLKLARVESMGFGNNVHAWNKVKVGGGYYFVDATTAGSTYRTFLVSNDQYRWADNKNAEPRCNKVFRFREEFYPHKKRLANPDYRRIIGSLRLPEGEKAPEGGLTVRINGVAFFIPAGESEITYMLKVKIDEKFATGILVSYDTAEPGFRKRGYYAVNGTVAAKGDATPVTPGETDLTGLDITLIRLAQPESAGALPSQRAANGSPAR